MKCRDADPEARWPDSRRMLPTVAALGSLQSGRVTVQSRWHPAYDATSTKGTSSARGFQRARHTTCPCLLTNHPVNEDVRRRDGHADGGGYDSDSGAAALRCLRPRCWCSGGWPAPADERLDALPEQASAPRRPLRGCATATAARRSRESTAIAGRPAPAPKSRQRDGPPGGSLYDETFHIL